MALKIDDFNLKVFYFIIQLSYYVLSNTILTKTAKVKEINDLSS